MVVFSVHSAHFNVGTMRREENMLSKLQFLLFATQYASVDCCDDVPDPCLHIFNSCKLQCITPLCDKLYVFTHQVQLAPHFSWQLISFYSVLKLSKNLTHSVRLHYLMIVLRCCLLAERWVELSSVRTDNLRPRIKIRLYSETFGHVHFIEIMAAT
jgi:hypothetical protein